MDLLMKAEGCRGAGRIGCRRGVALVDACRPNRRIDTEFPVEKSKRTSGHLRSFTAVRLQPSIERQGRAIQSQNKHAHEGRAHGAAQRGRDSGTESVAERNHAGAHRHRSPGAIQARRPAQLEYQGGEVGDRLENIRANVHPPERHGADQQDGGGIESNEDK